MGKRYFMEIFIMIPKQLSLCIWSIVCVLGLISVIEAKESRDIAKQVFPSVVMLVMEDENGQPLSLGSGFFVREGVVATNLHVVEGATGGYAKVVSNNVKYDITGYVAIDRKMDLVLLKTKSPDITTGSGVLFYKVITLDVTSNIAIGDEIFAVGNPRGLEGTFSKGIISGIRTIEEDTLLQITAPISPGSSGGPILNSEGNVIGISVATFKGGQNLNFAIPVSYLSKLLDNTESVKALSFVEKPEKKVKSILADLGERNTEGVIGHSFLWDGSSSYTFSLQNKLRTPVNNVYCLVVFYNRQDDPIEIDVVNYKDTIPAGLAKRMRSDVDGSIFKLTDLTTNKKSRKPNTKLEFRILDFQIVEDSEYEF